MNQYDSTLPSVLCVCPTYGRPKLLANAVACFLDQDYPGKRCLIILDDAGQYGGPMWGIVPPEDSGSPEYHGSMQTIFVSPGSTQCYWRLFSVHNSRLPSLPEKYRLMFEIEGVLPYSGVSPQWDVICNWDDDDIYLPHHISSHAAVLTNGHSWSYPRSVYKLDDPHGRLQVEDIEGNMWASCAYRTSLLRKTGFPATGEASFDLQFLGLLRKHGGPPGRSPHRTFMFRWQTTRHPHLQGYISSPTGTDQYARFPQHDKTFVERLEPRMDEETFQWYDEYRFGRIESRVYYPTV